LAKFDFLLSVNYSELILDNNIVFDLNFI